MELYLELFTLGFILYFFIRHKPSPVIFIIFDFDLNFDFLTEILNSGLDFLNKKFDKSFVYFF